MEPNTNRDVDLWKKAHDRAGFKMHFIIYIIAMAFLWVVWAFIKYVNKESDSSLWPLYPLVAWGLAVLLHYLIVYSWKEKMAQKEYNKLTKKKNKEELNSGE